MSKVTTERVIEIVEQIMGTSDRVEVDLNDPQLAEIAEAIPKSRVRLALSTKSNISVECPKDGSTITFNRIGSMAPSTSKAKTSKPASKAKPKAKPQAKQHQHTYVVPKMSKDIMTALLDDASHVLWFAGPTGTGKTVLTHWLCKELNRVLYQLNCHGSMGHESLFGEQTIEVDQETGQNHIVFKEGIVTKAMQEGLDEDGNEVGPAAILFIDEAGALPTNVAIALNRLLESDDPRRTITLENDGGRIVRSHSKFRIILAANTAGRGATDMSQSLYTAQMDALDISMLNRIKMTFRFGYDRKVEKHILMQKVGNDKVVAQILKFRDAIRDNLRAGKLGTPFSTRTIVDIADGYRLYNDLAKAIYYTTFEAILPEERAIYNEIAVAQLGKDILKDFVEADIDYM